MALKSKQLKETIIGVRVDAETRKALEKLATSAERTLSDFIRLELKKIIASKGVK